MKKLVPAIALLIFMLLMLVRPEYYIQSASKGLNLFATSVLPAIFPFYFCSLLLTKIGAAKTMSDIGKKPAKFLFNSPPEGAYIMTLSMMSGYPIGASMTAELYSHGIINTAQAKKIASFASTSGPVFILGTVGSAIFRNPAAGIIILFAHYLAAVLNGIIFRGKRNNTCPENYIAPSLDVDNVLQESIASSTLSMLYVGGYIVLGGMLVDTIDLLPLSALSAAMSDTGAGTLLSLLYGVIEMTRGCISCAELGNLQLSCALACAIISFGGLSVMLQNFTFLSKCGMKIREVLIRKTVQALLGFGIAFLMGFALK